ncbi:MAG: acylhydrolase [Acetatifactor sp.]|nr:acylhydrolase [Acetatifactor sp.]
MKWLKKWSFVIILMITGLIYYVADESLLKMTRQESMDSVGEGKPEEDWQLLEEDASGAVSGNLALGENTPEEPEGGETEPSMPESSVPEDSVEQNETVPEETMTEEIPPEPEIRFGRVEDDYFEDALFLGDSRTVGMQQYGGLGDIATFYASTGMTIYKLFSVEIVELPDQSEKVTIEEALQHQSFAKIYIMVGINEMGTGTVERFTEAYRAVVERLQELQPDAIIYIQGILKVTTARSEKGDYINNEGIEARNEALSQLADGEKVFYLDVNPAVCDEDGGLIKDYTSDGVHLKAKYISLWKEYLKDNAVLLD